MKRPCSRRAASRWRQFNHISLCVWSLTALCCPSNMAIGAPNPELMRSSFVQLFGDSEVPKFESWRTLVANSVTAEESDKRKKFNDFYNRRIIFKESIDNWSDKDYWPTPNETLGRGATHCTGYALAKYYSLKLAGVPSEKLRLVYVRAGAGSQSTVPAVAHMVVAYYPEPDSEPIILDNLISDMRVASRRPDLTPVFSFNEDGIFNKVSAVDSTVIAGISKYSKWESFLKKASEQGFR